MFQKIHQQTIMELDKFLPIVNNWPKEGIKFRDISPLLLDPTAREKVIEEMISLVQNEKIDVVVALDARGFIFGSLIAQKLGKGLVMIRKKGKIPHENPDEILSIDFDYEYSKGTLEIYKNTIKEGQHVLVVDDILATGGTAKAACELVKKLKGIPKCLFLLELSDVEKRVTLDVPSYSLFKNVQQEATMEEEKKDITLNVTLGNKNPIILLYHPSMELLADKIFKSNPYFFLKVPISWKRFPDKYPNISFYSEILLNKRVLFLGSLYDQETLLEQLSVIMILPRQQIKSLDIIFPYFAPGNQSD